jgi:hypothetical protein
MLMMVYVATSCSGADANSETAACELELPTLSASNRVGDAPGAALGTEVRRIAADFDAADDHELTAETRSAIDAFVKSSESYADALNEAATSADVMRVFLNEEDYTEATHTLRDRLDHDCGSL